MASNLLIISDRFANGGLETHILTYARKLHSEGYRLFLVSRFEEEQDYSLFTKRYDIHFDESDNVQTLFEHIRYINTIIEKEKIDKILVHPFLGIIPAFFASHQSGLPLIVTLHGPFSIDSYLDDFYDFFLKIVIFHYSKIILISEELNTLRLSYGSKDNFKVIPNPVDTSLFKSVESPLTNNIRNKWALVSRLDYDKLEGLKRCLKTASQIGVQRIDIFGNGEAKDDLVKYIDIIQSESEIDIVFRGFSHRLHEDLCDGYTMVAGMGRVVLEAAAMDIPVLLVGYDGVKGLLNRESLLSVAWSNFSGRGFPNISVQTLLHMFDRFEFDPSEFLLRNIVLEYFSVDILYESYKHYLDDTTYAVCPFASGIENLLKLSLQNPLAYLQDTTLMNRVVVFMLNSVDHQEKIVSDIKVFEKERELDHLHEIEEENKRLKEVLMQKEYSLSQIEKDLAQKEAQLVQKEELIDIKEQFITSKNEELNRIYNSNFWKVASKYYALKELSAVLPFVKLVRNLKQNGILGTVQKINRKSTEKLKKIQSEKVHKNVLRQILQKYPNETIIILPMLVDWNIPLFQRPQHLAKNLAREGYLYFYCTGNMQYDNVNGFEEVSQRCYLTNRFDLVDQIEERRKFYDLSSTDNITDWEFVTQRLDRGDGIIYQYIDEISDDLSGFKIPEKTWKKHFHVLKDERCIVIPSATKLENDVKKYRTKNYKLVTNGVEINHFSQTIAYDAYPDEIKKIVDKQKAVIGYFGAFASWFDYALVAKLAAQREDLEIVLLGWDYDGSIKKAGFEAYENITVLGPIDYQELPKYAACFDVSTIPFMINDITESTSPIKLFEYMAMGKPIVTTDMPECRKYKSVLIGKTHEEYIDKIDQALALKDDSEYKQILVKEAHENSWETKAKDIAVMIEQNIKS